MDSPFVDKSTQRIFFGIYIHSCKIDLGLIFSFDTEPSKKCFVSSACVKANAL